MFIIGRLQGQNFITKRDKQKKKFFILAQVGALINMTILPMGGAVVKIKIKIVT